MAQYPGAANDQCTPPILLLHHGTGKQLHCVVQVGIHAGDLSVPENYQEEKNTVLVTTPQTSFKRNQINAAVFTFF